MGAWQHEEASQCLGGRVRDVGGRPPNLLQSDERRGGLDLLELPDAVRGPHDLDPAGVHSGLDAIELDTSSEGGSGSGSVTGWCG